MTVQDLIVWCEAHGFPLTTQLAIEDGNQIVAAILVDDCSYPGQEIVLRRPVEGQR